MSNARARKYSPIFPATVTPNSVEALTTSGGAPYTRMSATISRKNKPDMVRTVLAFGKANASIQNLLTPGTPVELAIQLDGGSAKVIGLPRAKVEVAEQADAYVGPIHLIGRPYAETVKEEVSAILWLCQVHEDLHGGIIEEMLTGDSERPSEEPMDDLPEAEAMVVEQYGHILLPLINNGVDHGTAARITDLIADLPARAYLDDMRRLREQSAARDLIAA